MRFEPGARSSMPRVNPILFGNDCRHAHGVARSELRYERLFAYGPDEQRNITVDEIGPVKGKVGSKEETNKFDCQIKNIGTARRIVAVQFRSSRIG